MKKFLAKNLLAAASAFAIMLPSFAFANWQSTIYGIGATTGLPSSDAEYILLNLIMFLLRILTYLSILAFIIYGIMFLFSGSDSSLAGKAKSGVTYAIVGIAVGISGYIFINLVDYLLSGGGYGNGGIDIGIGISIPF